MVKQADIHVLHNFEPEIVQSHVFWWIDFKRCINCELGIVHLPCVLVSIGRAVPYTITLLWKLTLSGEMTGREICLPICSDPANYSKQRM